MRHGEDVIAHENTARRKTGRALSYLPVIVQA